MANHERFHFKTLEELREKIEELGVSIPLANDLSVLRQPVRVGHLTAPNVFAGLPMEGCDSNRDGSPVSW